MRPRPGQERPRAKNRSRQGKEKRGVPSNPHEQRGAQSGPRHQPDSRPGSQPARGSQTRSRPHHDIQPDSRPKRGTPAKSGAARPSPGKPEPTKTLERVLSKAGLGSRTQARSWIHERRVAVNGQVIENPDHWIDFKRDRITVDGKPLQSEKKVYVLLYKPKGFVTTAKDPDGRPTVLDLVKHVKGWISPVGRLDLETTGLLILTNDTQFAERLTNPDHKVPKTYQLKARGQVTDEQIEQLRKGVELSDGLTRPATVTRLRANDKFTFLEITITEGRNRQVRRMIETIGSKVMKLTRVAIGPIRIGDLQVGKHRHLTTEELATLDRLSREI